MLKLTCLCFGVGASSAVHLLNLQVFIEAHNSQEMLFSLPPLKLCRLCDLTTFAPASPSASASPSSSPLNISRRQCSLRVLFTCQPAPSYFASSSNSNRSSEQADVVVFRLFFVTLARIKTSLSLSLLLLLRRRLLLLLLLLLLSLIPSSTVHRPRNGEAKCLASYNSSTTTTTTTTTDCYNNDSGNKWNLLRLPSSPLHCQ